MSKATSTFAKIGSKPIVLLKKEEKEEKMKIEVSRKGTLKIRLKQIFYFESNSLLEASYLMFDLGLLSGSYGVSHVLEGHLWLKIVDMYFSIAISRWAFTNNFKSLKLTFSHKEKQVWQHEIIARRSPSPLYGDRFV